MLSKLEKFAKHMTTWLTNWMSILTDVSRIKTRNTNKLLSWWISNSMRRLWEPKKLTNNRSLNLKLTSKRLFKIWICLGQEKWMKKTSSTNRRYWTSTMLLTIRSRNKKERQLNKLRWFVKSIKKQLLTSIKVSRTNSRLKHNSTRKLCRTKTRNKNKLSNS